MIRVLYLACSTFLMRNFLLVIAGIFAFSGRCLAQQYIQKKNDLTRRVSEEYSVNKSNEYIKDGRYLAYYRKNIIASGNYDTGKRVGIWHFYDYRGTPIQNFNFDAMNLSYEAPEDSTSHLRYFVDKKITDTDMLTKPLRIGGRYFGYIPYLSAFKVPFSMYDVRSDLFMVWVELLVSPLGRLADYKVYLTSYYYRYDQTFSFDTRLFKEDDKLFIPATINKQPVICRILIRCSLQSDGSIDFYN